MEAKIAVALTRLLVAYLKRHPQVVEAVADELVKLIPGKVDNIALAFVERLIKGL